jgi:hypothetical protein
MEERICARMLGSMGLHCKSLITGLDGSIAERTFVGRVGILKRGGAMVWVSGGGVGS